MRLLDSVLSQGHPPERTELTVIDDASTDGTSKAVQEMFESLKGRGFRRLSLERNEPARGVWGARVQSLRAAAGADWVLAVDDDAVLSPGALARLLEAGGEPSAGLLGPRIVFLSRPELLFSGANYIGRWTGRFWSRDAASAVECDWVNGTAVLVRGELLRGPLEFCPDYQSHYWEADLCLQARDAGYRVVYVPSAEARHDTSLELLRPERLYYLYRNKYILFRRRFRGARRGTAILFHTLLGISRALARLALRTLSGKRFESETFGVVIRAFWDGMLDRRDADSA